MSERISKIFEDSESSDFDSDDDCIVEESFSEYDEEGVDYDNIEETEDKEDKEEENEDDGVEMKIEKREKKSDVVVSNHRDNAVKLLTRIFEKHGIGNVNRTQKIKEIETIVFNHSKTVYSYNENIRSIITNASSLNFIQLKKLITCDYFESDIFENSRKSDGKMLNNITCRLEPMSGIHKCKCGCDKIYSYELQTRSADEGMTVFLQCYECGKKWRN
jgi:DNA-directed RNA polymerase subunit M/transcription elongation factor TFIIS